MRQNAAADQTEELGKHTESARRMSDKHPIAAVFLLIVGSQRFWDIFRDHWNANKLRHFIRSVVIPYDKKHLVVYADNCTGQNKNNHVIKLFLALVHMGVLERVDYKFFVKGHTKNSCDRGFGHIRKHVSRQDCWTMDHIISAVNNSAISYTTVHISHGNAFFKSYKPVVTELYKNLTGVQQYQVFSMAKDQPSIVVCRKGPDCEATSQGLWRRVDGVVTEDIKVDRMFTHFLEDLSSLPLNSEKQCLICTIKSTRMCRKSSKTILFTQIQVSSSRKALKQPNKPGGITELQWLLSRRPTRTAEAGRVEDESRPTPKKARK
ncbi:hypothetical protein F444_08947 [Phytophthora nicotianae P1976]|uniref:DUF7869 domain-containing protein n=1 Tax=Phytophthora nicotianae P1976 TaxID=1317066 RepID=A0A081A975_PHYNI|nr:hypothetical protein F444_08947 [Phytophthora nicotianae P1976]